MSPLWLSFCLAIIPLAADDEKQDLSVLYIGDPGNERGQAFCDFLEAQFADVKSVHRDDFESGMEPDFDVALLDWGQYDIDNRQLSKLTSPIGSRDDFETPLVLLGSAGLLISVPWQTNGSWG